MARFGDAAEIILENWEMVLQHLDCRQYKLCLVEYEAFQQVVDLLMF